MIRKRRGELGGWLAGLALLLAAPISAQTCDKRTPTMDGEPTDPDDVLQLVDEADVDLGAYGLSASVPTGEDEALSWFEALLQLLRNLGIIPGGSD
jgi:hypothetical protein